MKRKIITMFFVVSILIGLFSVQAFAACSHSLGPLRYETSHPHKGYRQCTKCRTKIYTSATRTFPHGSGAVGSGTCKSCGTHTYKGRTCTSIGTCSCGITVPALGHYYESTVYYETAHPHKNFKKCSRCGIKYYTGATTTLSHGDGSSGTCKSCGSHLYKPSGIYQTEHPHKSTITCACGDSITAYGLQYTCSNCKENSKTTSSSTPTTGVMAYQDGDQGLGSGIFVPVTYYVEYTNTYNYPQSNDPMNNYNYPAFASFLSKVTSHAEGAPVYAPPIICVANTKVEYYGGSLLATQGLNWTGTFDAISGAYTFTLTTKPSYATAKATCNLSGTASSVTGTTTAYFG